MGIIIMKLKIMDFKYVDSYLEISNISDDVHKHLQFSSWFLFCPPCLFTLARNLIDYLFFIVEFAQSIIQWLLKYHAIIKISVYFFTFYISRFRNKIGFTSVYDTEKSIKNTCQNFAGNVKHGFVLFCVQ